MPDYATFRLHISAITPVHIGNGINLLNEYDYAIWRGSTWRIDESALLEGQDIDDPALADQLSQQPPARLLEEVDYQPGNPYFRYVIKGEPRSKAAGAQLHEQIKDPFDRVYLPGSSVKGALRTVLGWYAWVELGLKPDAGMLRERAKFAAQDLERRIFVQGDARKGREPNFDLMKAVQVSDSLPLDPGCLALINASVFSKAEAGKKQIPVEMEAIRPDTTFEARLKLDLALFSAWAQKSNLNLPGEEWIRHLPEIGRAHNRLRLQKEIAWLTGVSSGRNLLQVYQQMAKVQLAGNQFLLQLGWGTGWEDKTFGSRLQSDPKFMETIIRNYRMSIGFRKPGDPFPKSRRAAMAVQQSPQGERISVPRVPLGWVLVTLEPEHGDPGWLEISQTQEPLLSTMPATEKRKPGPDPAPAESAPSIPKAPEVPARPAATQPSLSKSREEPVEAPKSKVIQSFTSPPQAGDIFWGEVFDKDAEGAYLHIPGLDADTQAFAFILLKSAAGKKMREKDKVLCEVVSLKKEYGVWRVLVRGI